MPQPILGCEVGPGTFVEENEFFKNDFFFGMKKNQLRHTVSTKNKNNSNLKPGLRFKPKRDGLVLRRPNHPFPTHITGHLI